MAQRASSQKPRKFWNSRWKCWANNWHYCQASYVIGTLENRQRSNGHNFVDFLNLYLRKCILITIANDPTGHVHYRNTRLLSRLIAKQCRQIVDTCQHFIKQIYWTLNSWFVYDGRRYEAILLIRLMTSQIKYVELMILCCMCLYNFDEIWQNINIMNVNNVRVPWVCVRQIRINVHITRQSGQILFKL